MHLTIGQTGFNNGGPFRLAALAVSLVLLAAPVLAGTATETKAQVKLAVPIDTSSQLVWSSVIGSAPEVGMVVFNPDNGPGAGPDATSLGRVRQAQGSGILIAGYVPTSYADGKVGLIQAEGEVDNYYRWYGVNGIFFDQANSSCSQQATGYYAALYSYVKARGTNDMVVLNPGTLPGSCYATMADVLLTFENTYNVYEVGFQSAGWTGELPRTMFYHVVLDTPNATAMKEVVNSAVSRGAGWVFVTDQSPANGNPYDSLPWYFQEEVSYIAQSDGLPAPQSGFAQPMAIAAAGTASVAALLFLRKTGRLPKSKRRSVIP